MVHVVRDVPEWAEPLELAGPETRSLAIYSGRGAAKSTYFSDRMIDEQANEPATSSLCIRETQKSLDSSVKTELVTSIARLGLTEHFEVQDSRIRMRKGDGHILLAGMSNTTSDGVKSYAGYKRAWVEEGQSFSKKSLEILTPTIRLPGSRLWYSWNPENEDDPVDEMFRCNSDEAIARGQVPPPSAIVVGTRFDANPWFAEPLITEMLECRARDLDEFNWVWMGRYRRASEARIFKNVHVRECEPPKDAVFFYGMDFGYTAATVLTRCWIEGRQLFVDQESAETNLELDDMPAMMLRVKDVEKHTVIGDSASPQIISHLRKKGFKIVGATKGTGSVDEGIEFLRSFNIVVHPRCKTLIDEFLRFSRKVDRKTKRILNEPDWKTFHPNGIPALMYAVESVRRGIGAKPAAPTAPPPPLANHWNR